MPSSPVRNSLDDLDACRSSARTDSAGLRLDALVILAADDEPEIDAGGDGGRARGRDVRFSIGVHPHAAGKYAADPAECGAARRMRRSTRSR